jgi:hypothetical protein
MALETHDSEEFPKELSFLIRLRFPRRLETYQTARELCRPLLIARSSHSACGPEIALWKKDQTSMT